MASKAVIPQMGFFNLVSFLLKSFIDQIGSKCWFSVYPARGWGEWGTSTTQLPSPELGWT